VKIAERIAAAARVARGVRIGDQEVAAKAVDPGMRGVMRGGQAVAADGLSRASPKSSWRN
jgi:hypothetical protein